MTDDTENQVENVLTSEEIAALREGMPSGTKGPVDVDLGNSERKLRRRLHDLERSFERFSQDVGTFTGRRLRGVCSVEVSKAETIGPQGGQDALADAALVFRLAGDRDVTLGYIGFDDVLCFRAVESAFGGLAANAEVQKGRVLTAVERDTLKPLCMETSEAFLASIGGGAARTEICDLPPDATGLADAAVVWRLALTMESPVGSLVVVVTSNLVDCGAVAEQRGSDQMALAQSLRSACVELTARLGTSEVNLAELLSLRPGDLLRLEQGQNDQVVISLEGAEKFAGRPVQRNGVFGVEIERFTR